MNQGENAPPMHPRCRCTIIAYMEGVGKGERVAGRTRVSADVSYRQWLKSLPAPPTSAKIRAGFDIQRFGTYEEQVKSHGGSGNIKPDKIIAGHDRPTTAEPLSIIDHRDKHGKIDKRAFYDDNGQLYFEIHATDHNFPKKHPFGEHGEHSHKVIWVGGQIKWVQGQELTPAEREDNGDLL